MFDHKPIKKMAVIAGVLTILVCATIVISNVVISSRPIYVQYNTGADGKPVNNISVTATGKVTVAPDLVTFTTGYTTKKNDLAAVQADLKAKSNAITVALKALGIAEKDITTSEFNISPAYRWNYTTGIRTNDGHEGTVKISVKVRNLDKAGEIIDRVVVAGANIVENVAFTIDDMEKVRTDARMLAAAAAKTKAETLATSSGVSVGGLISISESSYEYQPYYNVSKNYLTAADSATAAPTAISAGSMDVSISVSATYAIK